MERQGNGKGIDIEIYLNKKIRLIIDDEKRVIARDGILKGYDELNYYLQVLYGRKEGQILGFLKKTVRRIEPLDDKKGGYHS